MARNYSGSRSSSGRGASSQRKRTAGSGTARRTGQAQRYSSARRRRKRRKSGPELFLAYAVRAAVLIVTLLILWFALKGIAGIFHPKDKEEETAEAVVTEAETVTEPETPEETEPDNRVFSNGRYLDPSRPMVALTYDDGPEPKVGNVIMDSLNSVDGRCTFFMVGNTVKRSEESIAEVKRMAEEGFEVANHSWAHTYYNKLSQEELINDVLQCNEVIKEVSGVEPAVIRLPGGIITDAVRNSVKMPIISWSIDTLDWKTREATSTINAVLGEDVHIQDGDIVLMHELYVSTGEASKVIIQTLTNMGFQLVTVSELIQYRSGGQIQPGVQYGHFYLSDLPAEMLQAPAESGAEGGAPAESQAEGTTAAETFPTDGAGYSAPESLPAESTSSL